MQKSERSTRNTKPLSLDLDRIADTLHWDGLELVLRPDGSFGVRALVAPWWFRWAVKRWPRLWVLVPQAR